MNEEIIKKLQALLRMTMDRGCTQGEMENAMAMAQKLAFKYRINLDELRENVAETTTDLGGDIIKKIFKSNNTDRHPDSNEYICVILNNFFGVRVILIERSSKIGVVGKEIDVDFAIYVYQFLRATFKKLWYVSKFENVLPEDSKHSFYRGLFESLGEKLALSQKEVEQEVGDKYAIVIVDNAKRLAEKYNEFFPDQKSSRARIARPKDIEAYEDGLEKGRKININQPIGMK